MKRLFDLVFSFFGLLLLLPFLVFVALFIWLEDRGPVFFIQRRVGLEGFPFRMFKFRSMRVGGEGLAITVGQDSRITRVGRFLRATKLDEFPQLWNVLRGEMSFVGPRPEVERYTALYTDSQRRVLMLKPGITDPASLAMFDEAALLSEAPNPEDFYILEVMPEKIRVNLEYASRANFFTDLLLIIATVVRAVGWNIDVFSLLKLEPVSLRAKI